MDFWISVGAGVVAGLLTVLVVGAVKRFVGVTEKISGETASVEGSGRLRHLRLVTKYLDFPSLLVFIVVISIVVLAFMGREPGFLSTLVTMFLIYWFWTRK